MWSPDDGQDLDVEVEVSSGNADETAITLLQANDRLEALRGAVGGMREALEQGDLSSLDKHLYAIERHQDLLALELTDTIALVAVLVKDRDDMQADMEMLAEELAVVSDQAETAYESGFEDGLVAVGLDDEAIVGMSYGDDVAQGYFAGFEDAEAQVGELQAQLDEAAAERDEAQNQLQALWSILSPEEQDLLTARYEAAQAELQRAEAAIEQMAGAH